MHFWNVTGKMFSSRSRQIPSSILLPEITDDHTVTRDIGCNSLRPRDFPAASLPRCAQ
jgi:hypothetical protein